jgi:hypothetical protein
MPSEILSAIFGFTGVIIGAFIPIIYQTILDRKRETKELREKNIEKMNLVTKNLNNIEGIINIFFDFLDADFDDYEYDPDRDYCFNKFCKIYNKKFEYFWDDIIQDLYLLLPDSTKIIYFKILNNFMLETKTMSENINEYFEDENITFEKIKRLQKSFEHDRSKYITALYAKHLLLEELQYNITGNNNNEISKSFYKKYENDIQYAIEHCA